MSKEQYVHKLINNGEYQGVKFWIVKNGIRSEDISFDYTWYCAYVEPPKDKLKTLKVDDLEVHGGITLNGYLDLCGKRRVWGWDYNHHIDTDFTDGQLKNKFQKIHEFEVIDIISNDCREFIGRYLV